VKEKEIKHVLKIAASKNTYAYVSGNEGLEEYADVGHTWVERAVQSVCKNALKYVLMYGLAHI
jgi:hypothetical protein